MRTNVPLAYAMIVLYVIGLAALIVYVNTVA